MFEHVFYVHLGMFIRIRTNVEIKIMHLFTKRLKHRGSTYT